MQPFLTAFDSVCLYAIGVYCQQVYRSLIFWEKEKLEETTWVFLPILYSHLKNIGKYFLTSLSP